MSQEAILVMSIIVVVFLVRECLYPMFMFATKCESTFALYENLKTSLALAIFVRKPLGIITVKDINGKVLYSGTALEQSKYLQSEVRSAMRYYDQLAFLVPSDNLDRDYNRLTYILMWNRRILWDLQTANK